MGRRKYQFKDRAEAEAAYRQLQAKNLHAIRALRSLYRQDITWVGTRNTYRVGLFDIQSQSGPRVLLVFSPAGQEPSVMAYDAYEWADETERAHARHGMVSDESHGLVDLATIVKHKLWLWEQDEK